MQFGLFLPQGWRLDLAGIDVEEHWPTISRLATLAQDGPWASLWVYDHFHTFPVATDEATHEAWTLMAALAASTDGIRLGQMCTSIGYRNPVYLAKIAATTDIIAGGRVEMGIGAGWYADEWNAYGYGFPSGGERLRMLDEGVQIMQTAWRDGRVSFSGKHFQVADAIVAPKPLQPGGLPLWIAGGGEKVTLRIAAQYASHTNFDGTPTGFAHKSAVLREHCRTLGRDFDAIVRTANYNVVVAETPDAVQRKLDAHEARLAAVIGPEAAARELASYRGMPGVGTPKQIVDNLMDLQESGLAYGICYFPDAAYSTESIELFAAEVIPALRD